MKYSVLMSSYKNDNPDYLKLALESIYDHQSKKPDEIIVIFDGPLTQQLYSVFDSFRKGKENIVKYYPQEQNHGLGEALRIGSSYCTGDYIFRMDSDDISDGERFKKQAEYVERHPEIDVLGGDIAEFKESPDEPNLRKRICKQRHEDIARMGKRRNPMNHVSVCIKKEALEKVGGYLPLSYVEDYYLWVRMINAGFKLENISETLVYVRVGNGFSTRRGHKEQIKSWRVLQDFMLENKMITKKEARINMAFIWGFVKTPAWLKGFLYNSLLRQ